MLFDDLLRYIRVNRFDPEYLPKFESQLFFEGEKRTQQLTNFTVLLLLSTIISTYGVISDSTATVIGAMIIAPLMTPIMATAAAVTIGSVDRMLKALFVVIAGVVSVVVLSMILTLITPESTISFATNTQIIARTSPGIYDLIIALAAGAAGAYALGRSEILDSLPGVAIAISLVPPLSVVGISLALGQWNNANGAFLLFITNFIAILLSGTIVFGLMGLQTLSNIESNGKVRKKATEFIMIGTIIIIILLVFTSYGVFQSEKEKLIVNSVAQKWFENTQFKLDRVQSFHSEIDLTIIGEGNVSNIEGLGKAIEKKLGNPVHITIHRIPEKKFLYPIQDF